MKLFFYVLNQHNSRTGAMVGKTCGVLRARDEEQAHRKLCKKIGENTALHLLEEFSPVEGYEHTVFKSSF